MAALKQIHHPKGTAQTTDGTTWINVCTYTLTSDCTAVMEPWLVGKDSTGKAATAEGVQSIERISSVSTLIGALIDILSFAAGSNAALSTSTYRITVSGADVSLEVKGVAATTIDWMGGFTIKVN